jgi:kynurenine formamidase
MRMIDLTLPLYDFMPVGNVWAWDVPFQARPITTAERNGYELTMVTMHSEAGTRLMIRAMTHEGAATVDQLPLESLVARQAVVVDAPCGEGDGVRTFTRLMRKDLNIFSRPTFWADLWEWLSCYSHWMPSIGSDTIDGMDEVRGGG